MNDTFIAETEEAIERYGQDAREPVPPPAVPVDVASLTVPKLGIRNSRVGRYGLDAFGRLEVPQDTSTGGCEPGLLRPTRRGGLPSLPPM